MSDSFVGSPKPPLDFLMTDKSKRRENRRLSLEEVGRPVVYDGTYPLATQMELDKRRADAFALKQQGLSLLQIGAQLHADPAANVKGVSYPGGYGLLNYRQGKPPLRGNALQCAVSKDVGDLLVQSRIANERIRQEAMELKLSQLEQAASAQWKNVLAGNARAHEVWLKNMEQQIRLLGLEPDKASTLEVNVNHAVDVQPEFTPEFTSAMYDALRDVGVLTEGERAALLPADGIIDVAEVVDVEPASDD